MNIVLRIGQWMDKKWPDKMTTSEVIELFEKVESRLAALEGSQQMNEADFMNHNGRIGKLESILSILEHEMKTIRTNMIVKTRLSSSNPGNMTAFASKLPLNGGNS